MVVPTLISPVFSLTGPPILRSAPEQELRPFFRSRKKCGDDYVSHPRIPASAISDSFPKVFLDLPPPPAGVDAYDGEPPREAPESEQAPQRAVSPQPRLRLRSLPLPSLSADTECSFPPP
jgi:hypothetical protein